MANAGRERLTLEGVGTEQGGFEYFALRGTAWAITVFLVFAGVGAATQNPFGFEVGGFLAFAVFLVSMILATTGASISRSVHFERGGIVLGTYEQERIPVEGRTLVLKGEPGEEQVLSLDDRVLVRSSQWRYERGTLLATQASELCGVPLVDLRPRERWERWEVDPGFRVQRRFDAQVRDSASAHPALHGIEPQEPPSTGDLDGITYRLGSADGRIEVSLDAGGVRCMGRNIRFDEIRDARVVFVDQRAELRILTRYRSSTLVARQEESWFTAHLLWLAAELRRLAAQYGEEDGGTAEDVPAALRALRDTGRE